MHGCVHVHLLVYLFVSVFVFALFCVLILAFVPCNPKYERSLEQSSIQTLDARDASALTRLGTGKLCEKGDAQHAGSDLGAKGGLGCFDVVKGRGDQELWGKFSWFL